MQVPSRLEVGQCKNRKGDAGQLCMTVQVVHCTEAPPAGAGENCSLAPALLTKHPIEAKGVHLSLHKRVIYSLTPVPVGPFLPRWASFSNSQRGVSLLSVSSTLSLPTLLPGQCASF